jgi:hypothetical protein
LQCWRWSGSFNQSGLPVFGAMYSKWQARRIVWEYSKGYAVPAERNVIMSCGNRWCVNPHHMRLGFPIEG